MDQRIREGERRARFFILGPVSRDLLQQSSESLAGRIAFKELTPFSFTELAAAKERFDPDRPWLRGGLPGSPLAGEGPRQLGLAEQFHIDLPGTGYSPAGTAPPGRAHAPVLVDARPGPGHQLNQSRLAGSLGVSGHTIRHYLDVLTDLYMVRQLPPWSGNSRKRLVESPKLYVRDSGLVHHLTNIPNTETLARHPLRGKSWEGFIVENLLNRLPEIWAASYCRTRAGAEIDLVLEAAGGEVVAIEIKRTLSPRPGKGFRLAAEDVNATRRFHLIPSDERFPIGAGTEAIGLPDLLHELELND